MIDRLYAVAITGLVSGPFAIYHSPHGRGFVLIYLPLPGKDHRAGDAARLQTRGGEVRRLGPQLVDLPPEEVISPDLQEMRNIHERLKPAPWIASDWGRGDR